ncbi:galactokinase [Perkinsus chesapeaki]|uniref:Galactokinase n=1 Tax=Perkinsus chesapeaki TaxID=330153 RepID=A0A7J6M5T0_PERCH|nr:galactokinase [Perkinsus chesapeaki]
MAITPSNSMPLADDVKAAYLADFKDTSPNVIVRSPGRVNLIGEHIDYNGFGVLPCAIERYTFIAAGLSKDNSSDLMSLRHLDEKEFPAKVISSLPTKTPIPAHHWTNYVLAAYMGLIERLGSDAIPTDKCIQMVVAGDLPRAAGVSSSSSLVVAAALAILGVFGLEDKLTRLELANVCADCERFVGTAGGGMDQAAILLSKRGAATHITFTPVLKAEPVPLPKGSQFIVANSLVSSAKAETAPFRYNKRVFECRIAAYMVHKGLGLDDALIKNICNYNFADLMNNAGCTDLLEMLSKCEAILPGEPQTRQQIASAVPQPIIDQLLDHRCGRSVWDLNDDFHLLERTRHVYTEANRVLAFAAGGKSLTALGQMLTDSHKSCSGDYDCSCLELDDLVHCFLDAGALGARLTGAGWGGCVVAMVHEGEGDKVMAEVRKSYYDKHSLVGSSDVMFSFEPADGAQVLYLAQ